MKMLQVIGPFANFHTGVLMLSDDQAHARAHALEDLGDGYFEILAPVQFKRGEIIGFDGEANKALLRDVEDQGDIDIGAHEVNEKKITSTTKKAKKGKA